MGIGASITSQIWAQMFWVKDDTNLVLPKLNIDPAFITVSGFSGGSYYGQNMLIMHSATFAGAGLASGGPYGAGYMCSNDDAGKCDATWRADMKTKIEALATEGKIDPVSNLNNKPVYIIGGALDPTQTAALQQAQSDQLTDFGANTVVENVADRGHTTAYDDPKKYWQQIFPNVSGGQTSYASASDVPNASYQDKTFMTDGYFLRFDQRAYTTKSEYMRANLDLDGWLYIPKRCADGTVAQCKLNLVLYGCGKKYRFFWDVLNANSNGGANGMIGQDFGFGANAHATDQVLLIPGRRDACYDMGAKDHWHYAYNNDPNYLNKEGRQSMAFMRMIDRLKEPKDASLDLTNMANAWDLTTLENNNWDFSTSDPDFSFGDRIGTLTSQNLRGWIGQYILP